MREQDNTEAAARLLRTQRWAALATVDDTGTPHASMVAYAAEADLTVLYLHLSRLAAHTGHLLSRADASLVVPQPDPGTGDPQTLPRLTLTGRAEALAPDAEAYRHGRALYLARLPEAEPRFDFADFVLFRLQWQRARYVGGFGRAQTLSAAALQRNAGVP